MNKELVQYIADARAHGLQEPEIKKNLLDAGWDQISIEDSLSHSKSQGLKIGMTAETAILSPAMMPQQSLHNAPPQAAPVTHGQPMGLTNQTITPSSPLSDASVSANLNGSSSSFFKKPIFWVILLVVVILGGGGYFAYAKFYVSPTKVWDKFTQNSKITSAKGTYDLKYSDPNDLGSDQEYGGFQLKDIFLELKGDAYADLTDPAHPQMESTINYTFGSGNTNISSGVGIRQIDQDLYIKVGDNPLLSNLLTTIAKKKYDWVKINAKDLQSSLSKSQTDESKELQADFNNLATKFTEIIKKHALIKIDTYVGKESVSGVMTLHYKNTLDKNELKAAANEMVDAAIEILKKQKDYTAIKDQDIQVAKTFINGIIDKFQIKEFETWVGKDDFQLYKVHFVSNMPSFIKLVKLANDEAANTGGDAKRIADIRQIASALEFYQNDLGFYPEGDNGIPVGLSPSYIGVFPTPPSEAGGNCPAYYNNYWYTPSGTKTTVNGKTGSSSYTLTFCLANDTGGYKSGLLTLSPSGIKDGTPCLGTAEQCSVSNNEDSTDNIKKAQDIVNKLDFSAELKLDTTNSDFGKKQQIQVPSEFFDLNKFIEDQMSSPFGI